jgi:hypothetical protein
MHELVKRRGKILMRRFKGLSNECFRIRLYVTGNIDALESVEYELHPSFPSPIQRVRTRRGGFPLEIWTWGEFDISVTFYPKVGAATETVYSLSYSNQLPAADEAYLDVSPASLRKGK